MCGCVCVCMLFVHFLEELSLSNVHGLLLVLESQVPELKLVHEVYSMFSQLKRVLSRYPRQFRAARIPKHL